MSTAYINHLRRKQKESNLNSIYQRLARKIAVIDDWEDIPEDFGGDKTDQMTSTDYQGHANWETWNVILWVHNEEGLYRDMNSYPGTYTPDKAEEFVRSRMPNGTPDMDSNEEYDLVDWNEVAEAFNEE